MFKVFELIASWSYLTCVFKLVELVASWSDLICVFKLLEFGRVLELLDLRLQVT